MQDHEFKLDPEFMYFVMQTRDCYEDKKQLAFQITNIDDLDEHDVDTYYQYVGASVQLIIRLRLGRSLDGSEVWTAWQEGRQASTLSWTQELTTLNSQMDVVKSI
jgi:hypothetical protein